MSENKANGPTPGRIINGAYEVMAFEGKHRVEISASQIRPGGAKGAGGEPVPEEYIPESYNIQSTLTADVTSQNTQFNFKLDGKKR